MRAHILVMIMMTMEAGAMAYIHSRLKALPLDMAPNSVDDAYFTCTREMSEQVLNRYLPNEKNSNPDFKKAWAIAEKSNKNKNPGNGLTVNHAIAIRVYTNGHPNIYDKFNAAVREGRNTYGGKFGYHALHFLLTDALKLLRQNKNICLTTYRGVAQNFDQNVVNKEIRLGGFASTSLNSDVAERFAKNKSCFVIYTCHGAALGKFSHLANEKEVLIPPYEKFKVVSVEKWESCEFVYTLKSTGVISNLDCALM